MENPSNEKVSIITRAYNRLEYTIKCIDNIIKYTKYPNYEHVIINNNSCDGTTEWLNWIKKNNIEYFKNVRVFHMDKNYGDWGGMIKSLDLISKDSKYIVQFDNDVEILDNKWLDKMVYALENTNYNIIQLKRIGITKVIKPTNIKDISYKNEKLKIGTIGRPVCCFILKTDDFRRYEKSCSIDLIKGKTDLYKMLGSKTGKIENLKCYIMDGNHTDFVINYTKYPHKLIYSSKNIR